MLIPWWGYIFLIVYPLILLYRARQIQTAESDLDLDLKQKDLRASWICFFIVLFILCFKIAGGLGNWSNGVIRPTIDSVIEWYKYGNK